MMAYSEFGVPPVASLFGQWLGTRLPISTQIQVQNDNRATTDKSIEIGSFARINYNCDLLSAEHSYHLSF